MDLARFDLMTHGFVLDETAERIDHEEGTYIAEGINKPVYTEFELKQQNGELVYFDKGRWQPYIGTLMVGLRTAQKEAALDFRKSFQVDRAAFDLHIGIDLNCMQPGERKVWHSTFPEKERQLYGDTFVGDLGYQAARRMGFIYLAVANLDGSVTLHSQSVDNSDDDAFEAALIVAKDPEATIEDMRGAYDAVLNQKYEADFYAGRPVEQLLPEENAWEVVKRHQDLMDYHREQIILLAQDTSLSREELEAAKKRLTYGVWGALKERLDRQSLSLDFYQGTGTLSGPTTIHDEVALAYIAVAQRGEVLYGCGGAITGEAAILEANTEQIFNDIFNKVGEDEYGPLTFKCKFGHTNTRPRHKLIEECTHCTGAYRKTSVRC